MDIKTLKLFEDVARHRNFAAVARLQDLDPSSISRTIAQLETELGIRLFQRTTRTLSITEAGLLYLNRIKPLLGELDRARDEALTLSNNPTGTLRLTTSVAFGETCLVPLISVFRKLYPDLKLDLLMTDSTVDLISEHVDLAIRLGPDLQGDLIGSKLMDTRYRVVATPEYLATLGPVKRPADLSAHACLLFSLPEFQSRWLFRDSSGGIIEIPVRGDIIFSNALALKTASLNGLGPALLADWMIDSDIKAGTLVDVFPSYAITATAFDTSAWLLYPSRAFLPQKVRVMIDFLRQHLQN